MKSCIKQFLVVFFLYFSVSFAQKTTNLNNQNLNVKDSVAGYTLFWNDEFDGTSLNSNHWKKLVGPYDYNGEVQYYTDRDTNSYVENGKLIIKAVHEHYVGAEGTREFTSARIISQNLADWKYGKIFVRAKLPKGIGTWPAIWLMPTESVYGSWPNSGEIDIMEHVGHEQDRIYGTIHTQAYNHRDGTQKGSNIYIPGATDDFHVYSVEWTKDFIEFSVDDNPYYKFFNEYKSWREWPFNQKFYMILNIAVGGGWGGQQGIDTSAFPVKMEIDYVRVYKKNDATNKAKYFVKHSGDNWAKHLMNDDGTDGDRIANDGIYSRKLHVSATHNIKLDWVVADTIKDVSHISWFYNPSPNDILFTYNTNTFDDNFLPVKNILNTNEELGNHFTLVVKGDSDTLKFVNEMTDDGNLENGDQLAGDKIYSLHKKITLPGSYIWYVHHNKTSWAEGARWAEQGKISSWNDTASVSFTTTKENQDVYFYLDVANGRVSTLTDTVFVVPRKSGYYFKYEGDEWINHEMYDDGTHGDKQADDGIYSLMFNGIQNNKSIVKWNVCDTANVNVSETAWFFNDNGTNEILFTFDSHTYRDGWFPKRNILNSNEAINNLTIELTGKNGKQIFENKLTDNGTIENGDTAAGDGIYAYRYIVPDAGKYTWYVFVNSLENARWTKYGKVLNKNQSHEITFVTTEDNRGINFYLNLNTGRLSTKVDIPTNTPKYKEYFVKHDGDGWKGHLMHDDGLFGDEVANDGIYSRLLTISTNKPKNDWAVGDKINATIGTVSWFYNPVGTNEILFTFDTNIYNDGWLPKTNIRNTDEEIILKGPIGINIDTTAYYGAMKDNGNLENGDSVAGDKIFSYKHVFKMPGHHKWFAFLNDGIKKRWDANGKQNGWAGAFPDSVDFKTTVKNQSVYFYLNILTGRVTTKSDSTLVSIKSTKENLPENFKLYQNYPNPFNPVTTIKYTIPNLSLLLKDRKGEELFASLKVYDILGREIITLVNKKQLPGTYKVEFDASLLSSGIYFYELKVGGYRTAKNMLLLK